MMRAEGAARKKRRDDLSDDAVAEEMVRWRGGGAGSGGTREPMIAVRGGGVSSLGALRRRGEKQEAGEEKCFNGLLRPDRNKRSIGGG